jgi:hypothetical protein
MAVVNSSTKMKALCQEGRVSNEVGWFRNIRSGVIDSEVDQILRAALRRRNGANMTTVLPEIALIPLGSSFRTSGLYRMMSPCTHPHEGDRYQCFARKGVKPKTPIQEETVTSENEETVEFGTENGSSKRYPDLVRFNSHRQWPFDG